jgi:hypothetical protein
MNYFVSVGDKRPSINNHTNNVKTNLPIIVVFKVKEPLSISYFPYLPIA